MPTVLRQRDVPDAIRSLSALPDYVDLFTVSIRGVPDATPEQWARVVLAEAAGLGGQFVWRALVGLQLAARAAPGHIAGWRIDGRGGDWIRLQAPSLLLTADVVVHVGDEQLSVATFIRYDRPPGSLQWRVLSAGHRRAMPGLLHRAVRAASRAA